VDRDEYTINNDIWAQFNHGTTGAYSYDGFRADQGALALLDEQRKALEKQAEEDRKALRDSVKRVWQFTIAPSAEKGAMCDGYTNKKRSFVHTEGVVTQ